MRLEQLAVSEHPALFECGGAIFFLSNLIFLLGNADNALFFPLKVFFETLIKSAKRFWEVEKKSTEYMRCSSSCNLTWVWKKELGGALKAANCMACGI